MCFVIVDHIVRHYRVQRIDCDIKTVGEHRIGLQLIVENVSMSTR